MKLPDGIHRISREDYNGLDRVNWSTLKHMEKSPAHYHHALLNPPKDTDAMKCGRCIHMAVFEPERFASECVLWDGGVRRGKDWDKFRSKFDGREILTESEHEDCIAIQRAVRSDGVAAKYVSGGQGEVTALWTHKQDPAWSIECKGRIDFVANTGALVDLKSCRDASPEGFGRQLWNLQYHVQAAYYCDGYAAATGRRLPYVIVAVEHDAPHVVQVYTIPDAVLELGRETYRELLERLAWCRSESNWPGYATGELELELPRWAVPLEDDVTDMDLIIHQ
jgi:hypothetical protein